MTAMCSGKNNTKEDLLELLSMMIINDKLPFSFPESQFFLAYTRSIQRFARGNSMEFVPPGRKTMTILTIEACKNVNKKFLDSSGLRKAIFMNGAGLHADGRKDAAGASNEVGLISGGGKTLLLATVEMKEGKSQFNLRDAWQLIMRIGNVDFPDPADPAHPPIEPEVPVQDGIGLASRIFYIASDCGSQSVCARRLMELKGYLSVPCMAHLFALIPTHLVSEANGVPWIIEIIQNFQSITHVFRTWDKPKMLLRELGGKMSRLILTRFMYAFAAIQKFKEKAVQEKVLSVFASQEFKAWEVRRSVADRVIINKAKSAVFNPEFSIALTFFLQLMTPWVQAMREFDRARNSISIVYKLMNSLVKLAADVLSEERYQVILDHSHGAPDLICEVLRNWVIKFDLPIFAAAHALAPYNHAMISALALTRETQEFPSMLDRLLMVFTVMAMRSPVEKGPEDGGLIAFAVPRSKPLARIIATEVLREFREDYLGKTGKWSDIEQCWEADLRTIVPSDFFLHGAPGKSILRHFAALILAMVPSTTEVERSHKINRDVITADRVALIDSTRAELLRASKVLSDTRGQMLAPVLLLPQDFLGRIVARVDLPDDENAPLGLPDAPAQPVVVQNVAVLDLVMHQIDNIPIPGDGQQVAAHEQGGPIAGENPPPDDPLPDDAAPVGLSEEEIADALAEASDADLLTDANVRAEADAIALHEALFAAAGSGERVERRRAGARIARMPARLQDYETRVHGRQ